ncbi:MAG: electron transport complex subunit E [Acholeplasmatales bacterium]|nr:electron transport complex subunit E [Acholeplasmatales bacterium]
MEKTKSVSKNKAVLLAGIITENPTFVSLLGMCPTLATTKSVEAAIGMGLLVILTLIGSNTIISLLRKVIPSQVKIPCYILIIATFVTILKMLTEAFIPDLYSSLGVFISLIVVNCIILGRAEAFASKNGPVASFFDGLGAGIGFTLAICVIALIREVVGTGALSFGVYFPIGAQYIFHIIPEAYAIPIFVQSAGGFLTLAFVLAFLAWRKNRKEAQKLAAERARIEELKAKKAKELAEKKALEAKQAEEAKAAATPIVEAKPEAAAEVKAEAKEEPKVEAKETPAEPVKEEVKEAAPEVKEEKTENKEVA